MFGDIVKENTEKVNKDKWPCYAVFNDDTIMVFNYQMVPRKTFSIDRGELTDSGRIEVNKWVCVSKRGKDVESTILLRKLLNV